MGQLLPEELWANIPQLGEASEREDPMVWVKVTAPGIGWTWYVIEMSQPVASLWRADDIAFFGWVVFWEEELKYFTMSDMEIPPGTVTQDATFTPCRLSAVMAQERGDRTFSLSQLAATPGAAAALDATGELPTAYLRRHWCGDWGELDTEDVAENAIWRFFALQRRLAHGLVRQPTSVPGRTANRI